MRCACEKETGSIDNRVEQLYRWWCSEGCCRSPLASPRTGRPSEHGSDVDGWLAGMGCGSGGDYSAGAAGLLLNTTSIITGTSREDEQGLRVARRLHTAGTHQQHKVSLGLANKQTICAESRDSAIPAQGLILRTISLLVKYRATNTGGILLLARTEWDIMDNLLLSCTATAIFLFPCLFLLKLLSYLFQHLPSEQLILFYGDCRWMDKMNEQLSLIALPSFSLSIVSLRPNHQLTSLNSSLVQYVHKVHTSQPVYRTHRTF